MRTGEGAAVPKIDSVSSGQETFKWEIHVHDENALNLFVEPDGGWPVHVEGLRLPHPVLYFLNPRV